MAETHEQIPTEVIEQDICDTEREIEQMQREMEYFEKSPPGSFAYRLDHMRAEYRRNGIRERREFIEKLRGILQTRER